jgi:hypothetical protein
MTINEIVSATEIISELYLCCIIPLLILTCRELERKYNSNPYTLYIIYFNLQYIFNKKKNLFSFWGVNSFSEKKVFFRSNLLQPNNNRS